MNAGAAVGVRAASARDALAWWLPVTLGLAAIYLPGLDNGLVFDDERLLDGTVFDGYAALQAKQRMLSYGSFVWLRDLAGDGWWKQRLFNLALHGGVVFLVYRLVRLLIDQVDWNTLAASMAAQDWMPRSKAMAARFGVLLFALNPVAVYAVAYLIQRSILMATFLAAASLYLAARAGLARGVLQALWLAAAALAYLLALFSKGHVLLLPVAALAVYLVVRRPPRPAALAVIVAGLGLTLAGAAFLFTRYHALLGDTFDETSRGMVALLEHHRPGIGDELWPLSIVNQAWLFFQYGLSWFIPNPAWLAIDLRPAFPLSVTGFPQVLGLPLYLGTLAGSLILMVRHDDWRRLLGLGLFLPLSLFPTEFALIWIQDPFVLYRGYLWALGLPILGALLLIGSKPRTIVLAAVVVGAAFTSLAAERVASLESEATAWADAAAKVDQEAPVNALGRWRPLMNHGNQLMRQGRIEEAAEAYARASRTGDPSGLSDYHLGVALLQLQRPRAAGAAFARAEAGWAMQGHHRGLLALQKGRQLFALGLYPQAIAELDAAIGALDREDRLVALEIRARSHLKNGQPGAAARDFQRILKQTPGERTLHIELALALKSAGKTGQALKHLDALLAEGDDAEVRFARALTLNELGRRADAREELRRGLALDPDNGLMQALAKKWAD